MDGNVEETYKSGEGHFTTTGIEPATPTAIDLGLPSGIKWASFNVGASRPEDPGDFFAWGETEPKQVYSWSTYKWCEGSANTLTKYNTLSSRGFVDNKTILELDDDVAHVRWGGSWRMPTKEEYNELFENCTWSLLDQNDESVIVLTSKINAETLIIPEYGCFWHSTIDFQNKDGSNDWRYIKYCVRPVTDEGVRIPVTGVSMKRKELTLTLKAMSPIPVIVSPSNATQPAIIWSSSNLDVATVDINGTVKAVSPGKTTITATTYDGGYSATMELTVVNGYAQPEAVDLGLPSGVKWASFNVGATKPEEYGNFYAWGETEPKDNYEYSNFKWINSDKYNAPYSSLDREDDAAAVNLGGVWRMPTSNEVSELKTNCNWTWTQKNGINGYLVESKKNNNSIFLPASGVRINNQFKDYEVSGTYLCSDRAHHDSAIHCLELHFDENDYYPNAIHGGSSSSGITIRAVCE